MKLANSLSSSGQNLLLQPDLLLCDPIIFLDHMQDTTAPLDFGLCNIPSGYYEFNKIKQSKIITLHLIIPHFPKMREI